MKSCCLLDSYYVVGSVCIKCLPCKCLCILTLKSHNTPLGSVLFSSPNHISQIKKQAREVKQLPQHHTASKVEKPGLDPGFWHLPAYTVNPHHSKHVPGTSSVSILGNVRNAASQISPQTHWIKTRILIRSLGDVLIFLCLLTALKPKKISSFLFSQMYIVVLRL